MEKLNQIVYNYFEQNTFKVHKYYSLNASNIEYFGIFASKRRRNGAGRSVWISLNHSLTNFKKWYVQKTSGSGTVTWFIRLGWDPTRGFTGLLLTIIAQVTRLPIDTENGA